MQRIDLVRQNALVFLGGLVAGLGSFTYHALAGRLLGPASYGQLAFLVAFFALGATAAVIVSLVLAREAAVLMEHGESGIGPLAVRASMLVAIPSLAVASIVGLVAPFIASLEHLTTPGPVFVLGIAIAVAWMLAVPRGLLQGLLRFKALALNLSLDPVVRVSTLWILLTLGYGVGGAVAAVACGLLVALIAGVYSLRDRIVVRGGRNVGSGFLPGVSLTVAAGVVGVQLLFNQDIVLAEHYLPGHDGGIYGGLNKIGTIVFYLTLSVSQVLFPRVTQAVSQQRPPGQLLLSSVVILLSLGTAAVAMFAFVPSVVVDILYGSGFRDAVPYVPLMGCVGLAISLDNLLIQFYMAMQDRWFVPVLVLACAVEFALIVVFHGGVGQVIWDVLASVLGLLVVLLVRCYLLLRPDRGGAWRALRGDHDG